LNLQQVIKECGQGREAARKQLFDHLAESLLTLCCRYLKNTADAEEIMLNGFQKIFSHIGKFRYESEAGFYGWARKIMVNECLMFLRKENAFSVSIENHEQDITDTTDAISNLSAAEIYQAIVQLPAGYRTVFNLFEIEGYTHKEIATMLGINEGTSKSQLSKAKNWLQQLLKKNEQHEQRKIQ
jgi:RNA polymerase sigma factor (sigma-70 family)